MHPTRWYASPLQTDVAWNKPLGHWTCLASTSGSVRNSPRQTGIGHKRRVLVFSLRYNMFNTQRNRGHIWIQESLGQSRRQKPSTTTACSTDTDTDSELMFLCIASGSKLSRKNIFHVEWCFDFLYHKVVVFLLQIWPVMDALEFSAKGTPT